MQRWPRCASAERGRIDPLAAGDLPNFCCILQRQHEQFQCNAVAQACTTRQLRVTSTATRSLPQALRLALHGWPQNIKSSQVEVVTMQCGVCQSSVQAEGRKSPTALS